jgi:hypothetical protein
MTEDEALDLFGIPATASSLPKIRGLLSAEAEKENRSQGRGDTALMKLLSVNLFLHGHPDDALVVWRAKTSSMDADASIDIQLLCGAGAEATLEFLKSRSDKEASAALARINECAASGDFIAFSPEGYRSFWLDYYGEDNG